MPEQFQTSQVPMGLITVRRDSIKSIHPVLDINEKERKAIAQASTGQTQPRHLPGLPTYKQKISFLNKPWPP
jgi:hypothetical protein